MSKRAKYMIWICIFLGLALFILLMLVLIRQDHRWEFDESNRRIANPDRGFYIQVKSGRSDKIPDIAEEVRIILLAFDMEGYTEGDLPEEKLEELDAALRAAREERVSVVFRAAYGFRRDVEEPEELELMGKHIAQISEVLNTYEDQILVVQAGMLGAYGEWHSSRFLDGEEEEKRDSRLYILRQWDACLAPKIKVAVRRPRFVREAMAAGILSGRLGIHNDALLSTDSDMGTYDDPDMIREDELAWMREWLSGQVNGGEMPTPGILNEPENADYEFSQLHIGYLNLKYNNEIIRGWSEMTLGGENARNYLENHLGYRLFISEISMKKIYFAKELSGWGAQMQICLCNSGYAPLLDKYKLFLVVSSASAADAPYGGRIDSEQVCTEIEVPELYQISNGQSATAEIRIEVSESFLQKDIIQVGLKIAQDENDIEAQNCVKLANDKFFYENGVNEILYFDKMGFGQDFYRCVCPGYWPF